MIRLQNTLGVVVVLCVGFAWVTGGCRAIKGAEGSTPDEQRTVIQEERNKTLLELYAAKPETKDKIARAVGYGYFSNVNVNVFVMSTENGYGVVRDNQTGKDTYMKMAGAGVGVGMGVKDYRAIFIFKDAGLMKQFVETGFDFGGGADAAAKVGSEGAAASKGANVATGLEVYQFTKNGLALQATVQGTKYWRDDKLNSK